MSDQAPITAGQDDATEVGQHKAADSLKGPWAAARTQWRQVADQLRPRVPKLANLMDEADFPIPNRHAVTHGRVSYSSPRDSMNSLVIADFMLTLIDAIASRMEELPQTVDGVA
jgi:hypothetical protein